MTDLNLKKKIYHDMLLLRIAEEYLAEIYHQANEIKTPMHLYTGQEAVAVGVCNAVKIDDIVSPYHRSHGWYLAKGGNLNAMMAELFGKDAGCCKGWGGSMHLIDLDAGVMGSSSILAGTIPHAVGGALAFQYKGLNNVSIAPCGDAATEEGVFHESMNWASLKKLPVIFICENNLYSTSTPLKDRQPNVDIYQRAAAYGMPGVRVDGTDVMEVYDAAKTAVERARSGQGPTLIEAMTYRFREHVGPKYDYDIGYRSKEELDEWMAKCPVKKFESNFDQDVRDQLTNEITQQVHDSVEFARQAEFPIWGECYQ